MEQELKLDSGKGHNTGGFNTSEEIIFPCHTNLGFGATPKAYEKRRNDGLHREVNGIHQQRRWKITQLLS